MQIYILNRARETLATTASIYNDKHTLTLEAGSSSYEFTIDKSDEASHYLDSGNYIVLQDDKGKTWLFTILDYEETHNTKTVYAEDAGIELINKAVDIWKGDGPHPFSYYFDLVTKGTPWKLGVNQLAGLSRALTYEGRDTGLGRLLSILKGFDNAECTFDVVVKMNAPAEFKINVYKQVGNDRSDVQIVYNNELNDITKKESRAEFVTALAGVGGQIQTKDGSEGGNVDFSKLEYNKDGFVTKKGDKFLRAVDANRAFNPGQESYIESFYEYDTQSPSELLNRTLSKLKTYSEPQYTYTADVKVIDPSLVLGDTVTILDHDYNPAIYLSARVAKLVKSYTDPTQNEIEFTNYRLLSSALADKLARLQVIVNTLPSASRVSAIETNLTKLTKQQEEIIVKVESANGKNTNYYGGSQPESAKQGDSWFYTDEEGNQGIKQYQNGVWVDVISSKFGPKLEADIKQTQDDMQGLSSEVESAKKQAQEAFAKAGFNADEISNVKTATSEVTETLTSTVRQASELSESLKNVASETASRYSTVSSELSGAKNSLNAKASELASEVASNSANITKANSQLYSQSEGLAKVSQSATKMEQTMTDLSGRVHTVETTASETKESLADAKGNITTLTKRADGTDTKIADAQGRVSTLESRAGKWDLELSKKVDNATYNAGIQNLGNQINLKANKSDLDGYATKAQLSVESDRITQQASAISSVTTIANGANSKIDNLSFGGRNLLDRSNEQFVMGSGITNTTWENGKAVLRYNSADVSRNSEILPQNAAFSLQFPVARGEQLTQSIYLDTDANINFNNNFEFSWFDFKDGHKFVRANIDKIGQNTYRLWGSYTWDKNDSNLRIMDISNLYKVVDFRNSGTYLAFYHPQIEKGSRPSDYSLSQNDLQRLASENTANQINTFNTGTVQPIKGIANDALGKANNANNKIDGLKIGGRNLLKGTSDQLKTITASGWMNAHTYSNYPYVDLSNFHTGDYLTYSVWVTNTSDVPIRAEIYCFDNNKAHTHTRSDYNNVINPGNSNWLVITMQIERNDRYARPSVITTSGQTGTHTIRMREEMLTLGNVRLPWQPSDLDLPDTIVSTVTTTTNAKQIVDKSGIYSEVNKLVDTKVGNVTTQLETYKHTVDDTGNKLNDLMGAIKYDPQSGKLTSNFNELIKTASGVEERYTQLNGKIDGIVVGGKNLLDNSDSQLIMGYGIDTTTWTNGKATLIYNHDYSKTNKSSEILPQTGSRNQWYRVNKDEELTQSIIVETDATYNPNGVYQFTWFTSEFSHRPITANIDVLNTNKYRLWCSFKWDKDQSCNVRIFDIHNLTNVLQINTSGTYISFYHPQVERGNKPSDWGMSDNDINKKISDANASIAKTNETIKTVDGNITTVKNNLDKTKSVVTQLANLFDVTVGDSSVSVTNNGVLVKGKQIHIDGQTVIDNGVIQGAKIADASIGTAKIADAAITSAKIANLDVNKLSGNKSTFVQSVWNGISNSINITPTGLESASGSNQTTITGGRIETNSLWAKDYITVGRHESDPRQRWGIDIDSKGMWFGVPVKKNGAAGNNAGDYQYEIQGAIKGYGWDYARTEINGNGASGIMIGLAEQGMWGGNYGGDFIGIGRFVKNEYQTLDSAQHDFALTYNATSAGFAVPGNAVHIWKDTYIHGTTHLGYDGTTKNKVGIRTAWVSWSDWHNEKYACLVNDGPYWGGIAFPYNGNTVIFSWSGKRDSWAGSGPRYTGYGDY